MTTIVTDFLKFRYNRLLMGIFTSVDILQAKLDEIPSDIKGIKNYYGDILALIK